jgi:hypothetical protein
MLRAVRLALPCVLGLALLTSAASARADGQTDQGEDDPNRLRGPRIGFIPGVGFGMRAFTAAPDHFVSFVGVSVTQLDISYEGEKIGGFLRGGFLSSGEDGRWTAPTLTLGGTYRLFGDGEERPALVARAGLLYERWHANTAGCNIPFFYPDSCQNFTTPPSGAGGAQIVQQTAAPSYNVTVDTMGVMGGLRYELPVSAAYLALSAELMSTVDVSQASPGLALGGQITFSFGFRNHQAGNAAQRRAPSPSRFRENR